MSENRLSCLFHFRVLEDRVPVGRENPFFFVATTPVGRNLSLRAFIGSEATPPLGNMMLPAGASGSSSSNPRWNLDLNLHPREEVEVPAEEAPQLDMDVYGEKDQDRIKEILDFQLRDKISKKENEIRRVLEGLIEGEILKRKFSSSDFDFRNLDQFVGEVIGKHAPNFAPNDQLQKKHKSISWLLTQLRKDDSSINFQVKRDIERNLLDFIVQE